MSHLTISLPDPLKEYVEQQVEGGRYATISQYLRELIEEDQQRTVQEQREAQLVDGLESGEPIVVTPAFWQELWSRVDASPQPNHDEE